MNLTSSNIVSLLPDDEKQARSFLLTLSEEEVRFLRLKIKNILHESEGKDKGNQNTRPKEAGF